MEPSYVLVEDEPEPKYTGKKIAGTAIALGVLLSIWIAKDRLSAAVDLSPSCVVLLDQHSVTDAGVTRIFGTVKNGCRDDFGTVMVFFKLRDNEGKVVGQTGATRRVMSPGATWDFETTGFFTPPNYDLDRITAY